MWQPAGRCLARPHRRPAGGPAGGRRQAEALAAQQRNYAEQDASIEPQGFVAPDVTAPGMRRLARQHGVDYDRWLARQ